MPAVIVAKTSSCSLEHRRFGKCKAFCKAVCCGKCCSKSKNRQRRRPNRLTRRVEHVDYVRNRPKASKCTDRDTSKIYSKQTPTNASRTYFLTVNTKFAPKCPDFLALKNIDIPIYNSFIKKTRKDTATMELPHYCSLGNDLKKIYSVATTRTFGQCYEAASKKKETPLNATENTKNRFLSNLLFWRSKKKRNKRVRGKKYQMSRNDMLLENQIKEVTTHETNIFVFNMYDFGCQHNTHSSNSLEITSHTLTKSNSKQSVDNKHIKPKKSESKQSADSKPSFKEKMFELKLYADNKQSSEKEKSLLKPCAADSKGSLEGKKSQSKPNADNKQSSEEKTSEFKPSADTKQRSEEQKSKSNAYANKKHNSGEKTTDLKPNTDNKLRSEEQNYKLNSSANNKQNSEEKKYKSKPIADNEQSVMKKSESTSAESKQSSEEKTFESNPSADSRQGSKDDKPESKPSADTKQSSKEVKYDSKASADSKHCSNEAKSESKASADSKHCSNEAKSESKASADSKHCSNEAKSESKSSTDRKHSSKEAKSESKPVVDSKHSFKKNQQCKSKNALHVMIMTLARKIKPRPRAHKHKKDDVVILHSVLKLKESGRVRHVGVSNLNAEQLARVAAVEKPSCLQVEVHALCQQVALVDAANKLGVPVVAYSPLGSKALADALAEKTGREYPDLLQLPAVKRTAEAHARTPAQVLLRYNLQRGLAAIPKSTNPERIKQNISLWDFELSPAQMSELAALDRGEAGRICDFSFFIGIEKHPEFPFKK